jgi:hypothetical protein
MEVVIDEIAKACHWIRAERVGPLRCNEDLQPSGEGKPAKWQKDPAQAGVEQICR